MADIHHQHNGCFVEDIIERNEKPASRSFFIRDILQTNNRLVRSSEKLAVDSNAFQSNKDSKKLFDSNRIATCTSLYEACCFQQGMKDELRNALRQISHPYLYFYPQIFKRVPIVSNLMNLKSSDLMSPCTSDWKSRNDISFTPSPTIHYPSFMNHLSLLPTSETPIYNRLEDSLKKTKKCRRSRTVFTEIQVC